MCTSAATKGSASAPTDEELHVFLRALCTRTLRQYKHNMPLVLEALEWTVVELGRPEEFERCTEIIDELIDKSIT